MGVPLPGNEGGGAGRPAGHEEQGGRRMARSREAGGWRGATCADQNLLREGRLSEPQERACNR